MEKTPKSDIFMRGKSKGKNQEFRVVRILLDTGEYETLATRLPRSITADEIKKPYYSRWGIETTFMELNVPSES